MSTRFCLIRHGETDWNAQKRVQGQIDIDLNAVGEAQARALADALGEHSFAAVYSSDLARAWRTACSDISPGSGFSPLVPFLKQFL